MVERPSATGHGKTGPGVRGKKRAGTGRPAVPAKPMGRPQRLAHLLAGGEYHQLHANNPAGAHASPAERKRDRSAELAPRHRAGPADASAGVLCVPNPEWLPHILTVTGPAGTLAQFRQAAAGPGRIPWQLDAETREEDWMHRLLAPVPAALGISVQGARIAARQLREALEILEGRLRDDPRHPQCPLDINVLIPVPAHLLVQGPEAPVTLAWLWEHWGTTWPLRHVEEISAARTGVQLAENDEALCVGFYAADWTPWRALAAMRSRWPALTFTIEILAVTA